MGFSRAQSINPTQESNKAGGELKDFEQPFSKKGTIDGGVEDEQEEGQAENEAS